MIKHFFKIFIASLALFMVLLSVTALGYILLIDRDIVIGTIKKIENDSNADGKTVSSTFDYNTPLGKVAKQSSIINVLVVGLEDLRTDTIMVASYDIEKNIADLISVPRDTYFPRDANDSPEFKKINAIYSEEGIEGLIKAVQDILGIPIERYLILDYEGVVACVDIIGGVEVNVPFHMLYQDPYDDPPLNIDIPEGLQLLDGKQSLNFLRYRKGYSNQDLGRIEAQQNFIKSAAKKALSIKLPLLIKEAYSHVKTNFNITDLLNLAAEASDFSTDSISLHILPGMESPLEGLSFFIPDDNEIRKMVYTIYDMPLQKENLQNN